MADRVVVMNEGRIEQVGTPDAVYERAANPFVYNFLGRVVSLQARVQDGQLHLGGRAFALPDATGERAGHAVVFARPQDVRVTPETNGGPGVEALIKDVNHAGPLVYLELERRDDGTAFQLEIPSESALGPHFTPGMSVHLNLKKYRVFVEDYTI